MILDGERRITGWRIIVGVDRRVRLSCERDGGAPCEDARAEDAPTRDAGRAIAILWLAKLHAHVHLLAASCIERGGFGDVAVEFEVDQVGASAELLRERGLADLVAIDRNRRAARFGGDGDDGGAACILSSLKCFIGF